DACQPLLDQSDFLRVAEADVVEALPGRESQRMPDGGIEPSLAAMAAAVAFREFPANARNQVGELRHRLLERGYLVDVAMRGRPHAPGFPVVAIERIERGTHARVPIRERPPGFRIWRRVLS